MNVHELLANHRPLVYSLIVAMGMSFFIGFFMTLINTGLNEYFLGDWFSSFLLGSIVGLPVSLMIVPYARSITEKISKKEKLN